jgi:hypothetical protein
VAEERGGVVVGTVTKTDSIARRYHKYKDAADIYPIYGMLQSQAEQLARWVFPDLEREADSERDELEWAIVEDGKSGIIRSITPPQQNGYWFKYTIDQKRIIARLHDRQRKTLHKDLEYKTSSVCPVCCPIPTLLLK